MRYLIFANTPAHVHLYKHVVKRLEADGDDVLVLVRDYGCTVDLAAAYDLPFEVYGACDTTKGSLLLNLPGHYLGIARRAYRFDPDLVFGMGAYAAHAGAVADAPTVLLLDSEPTHIDHVVSRPFAHAILTPDTFRRNLGEDHYAFSGFKECAYLHPEVFEPDPSVRDDLGVVQEPFVLLRFNAFGSHHDVARGGFDRSQRRNLVRELAEYATVVVSDEGGDLDLNGLPARPFNLHPSALHDALAEASLLVADTQTMVTEAALLGTPAIRSNSFVGDDDMGNFLELADRNLIENVSSFDAVRTRATEILTDDNSERRWNRRRDALLTEKVNLVDLLERVAHDHDALETLPGLHREWVPPEPDAETAEPARSSQPTDD